MSIRSKSSVDRADGPDAWKRTCSLDWIVQSCAGGEVGC